MKKINREDLLRNDNYWISKIQQDLYAQIEKYIKEKNINKAELANKLGVTKGYITQVLNGDFDHKISKLVSLSMAIGLIPMIDYADLEQYIEDDALDQLDVPIHQRPIFNLNFNSSLSIKVGEETQKFHESSSFAL